MAALSICEALLLALHDAQVLPENEIMGVLSDVTAAHEDTGSSGIDLEMHTAAAALINKSIASARSET